MSRIPLSRPFLTGREVEYVRESLEARRLSGDGPFSQRCEHLLAETTRAHRVLLTTSGTAALELAALLCDLQPGDEVILPSFTFPSTANAFVLRGARLVFVDVCLETMNIDCAGVAAALTERTRVIVPVHYAGNACDMHALCAIGEASGIRIVEDAAHAVHATYSGRYLGTFGDLGTFSFHDTKNFVAGEGGALLINDPRLVERAEVLREKGTNRRKFLRGAIDKYTWVDVGSSYVPSDVLAAILYAQLQSVDDITERRQAIYDHYAGALTPLEEEGRLLLPRISEGCVPNYHAFFLRTGQPSERDALIEHLGRFGIRGAFHFIPLHTSPMGERLGYRAGMLPVTEEHSERLLRLPLYADMTIEEADDVCRHVLEFFRSEPGSI